MKRFDQSDTSWHELARAYYCDGHTWRETYDHVRKTHDVSDRTFRTFKQTAGVSRGRANAQQLKRFACVCAVCHADFKARTPTALMCEGCVGDDHVGKESARPKRYQYLKRIQSYGIGVREFELVLQRQENRCGLCERKMRSLCIDHDHVSGKVRGLLCNRCNLLLGQIELSNGQKWLQNAIVWLTRGE